MVTVLDGVDGRIGVFDRFSVSMFEQLLECLDGFLTQGVRKNAAATVTDNCRSISDCGKTNAISDLVCPSVRNAVKRDVPAAFEFISSEEEFFKVGQHLFS